MPTFTPAPSPTPGTIAPVTPAPARRIKYGDHPRMDGSIKYGEMIAGAGLIRPTTPSSPGTFTPSS